MRCVLRGAAKEVASLLVAAMLWTAGVSPGTASASEARVEVQGDVVMSSGETLAAARVRLASELRKRALQKAPTVVEWERRLEGERYDEQVREITAGVVQLLDVQESIGKTERGVVLTGRAVAVVDTTAAAKWAGNLDENERLRAEARDARGRSSIKETGSGAGMAKSAAPSTRVRIRIGDVSELAKAAERQQSEMGEEFRESLRTLLKRSPVELSEVRVFKSPESQWTGVGFGLRWELRGFADFERVLGSWTGVSRHWQFPGMVVASASMRGVDASTAEMRSRILGTSVMLVLKSGEKSIEIPVAYPAERVEYTGAAACTEGYGREPPETMPSVAGFGWCMLEAADAKKEKTPWTVPVRARSTLWVKERDVATTTGPDAEWMVRWPGGKVERLPAVVEWSRPLAQSAGR